VTAPGSSGLVVYLSCVPGSGPNEVVGRYAPLDSGSSEVVDDL
jgi:hypothetical protein